jgi:hypothetical protein
MTENAKVCSGDSMNFLRELLGRGVALVLLVLLGTLASWGVSRLATNEDWSESTCVEDIEQELPGLRPLSIESCSYRKLLVSPMIGIYPDGGETRRLYAQITLGGDRPAWLRCSLGWDVVPADRLGTASEILCPDLKSLRVHRMEGSLLEGSRYTSGVLFRAPDDTGRRFFLYAD